MKKSETYLKQFEYELKRRNKTSKNYVECIKLFFGYCKEINVHDYDYILLAKNWINRLQWQKKAAKTINLHIAAIKSFSRLILNTAISKDELPRLKEPKKLPDPLSKEEINRIFYLEKNIKHLLILQVGYYCGMRLSDIVNLKVKNIRFDSNLIHIENGKGMKDRFVPLPDKMVSNFRDICSNKKENDFVFTTQYTNKKYPKRTIQKIFENACIRSNIKGKKNPHRFRHSCGAHMVKAGVNLRVIQEMFGHSSSKTTEIYTRVGNTNISEVRNVLTIEN